MIKLLSFLLIMALVLAALAKGVMLDFIFLYPMFMSFLWVIGGLYFYFQWERKSPDPEVAPEMAEKPFVSVLVPCYNESANVEETIFAACSQEWPNYEVIAINDGSSDPTAHILSRLLNEYDNLRVINLADNRGKAMALRMGALFARGEYLVCIDGDAMLHPNALAYLVKPMVDNPRVGAVTGNPRVRTRSTIVGKVQVGEFSSIIGLIKRAQRIYGQIFTISGVISGFRRRALHQCGYWDPTMITEDIDVSWTLQLKHWQVQYEPNALCWILMPETLRGLWRQRVRWAQGGAEVFFKSMRSIWRWQDHRMWAILLDFVLSAAWAYSYLLCVVLWIAGKFITMPAIVNVPTLFPPAFWGLMLATVNILQFVAAMIIERRYEKNFIRMLYWMIWYPIMFWIISLLTTLEGIPRALFKSHASHEAWGSSDRGFR